VSDIRKARKAVVARVLEGRGEASQAQCRATFDNAGLTGPVGTLIQKVALRAYEVTDQDVEAAKASGMSEQLIQQWSQASAAAI
jgi:hypothetical protein